MKRKVIALILALLAFFLFVGSPFQQSAQAVVLVDDALIVILVAALAACGITFVTSGAFETTEQQVASLFDEYCMDTNQDPGVVRSRVSYGRNSLGQLLLDNRFVQLVQAFGTWLVAKFSLVDNSTVALGSGMVVGDVRAYKFPLFGYVNTSSGDREIWALDSYQSAQPVDLYAIVIATEPMTVIVFSLFDLGGVCIRTKRPLSDNYDGGNYYWNFLMRGDHILTYQNNNYDIYPYYTNYTIPSSFSNSWNQPYLDNIYTTYTVEEAIEGLKNPLTVDGVSVNTSTIVLPNDDPTYESGDGAILDVGADWGASFPEIVDGTIPGEFSYGKEGEADITYDSAETVEQQVEDSSGQYVSEDAAEYQVIGLESVFPFCIPFDLYNFVECLAADPVAPNFTWRFYVPGICDENITIDLSGFDQVAQLLRTMELLLFCVGLAFVTRKIIRG